MPNATRAFSAFVPARNEGWNHSLVAARRDAKEVDDRNIVLERLAKPPVVGCIRILSHECIVDALISLEDLPVNFALIVIPDPSAWLGKDGLDRQKVTHLLRFEDPAFWI